MPWHSIRGHDRVVDSLRRALAQGRMPHAFLFVGPAGVGKRTFALRLAQALLCEKVSESQLDPCGACPGCLQVLNGAHPDLIQVGKPEDRQELPIRVIRELCLDLGLKPARGSRKVAIVDDADDLNDEAANAFLKTLEEPPTGSVLILVGTSAELQLDTIISRCRVVRFDPLSDEDLATLLVEQGVVKTEDEARRLARTAEGSVARARGLASPALAPFRRTLLDEIASPRGFDAPALAKKVEAFCKEAGKESMHQRERAHLLIGELARFFRGVLWQTAGLEPPSADPNDRRAVEQVAQKVEPEDVFVLADRCLAADAHVARNAYLPVVLDSLMHDLARTLARAR